MGEFEYRVIDQKGQNQHGTMAAASQEALVENLQSKGYTILDVRPAQGVAKVEAVAGKAIGKGFRFEPFGVPERAVVFFTRQFATTLHAGLPMLRALATLQAQSSSPGLSRVIHEVSTSIQHGQGLGDSMARHPKVFNSLYISMIKVGEASGSLETTVARLASILEKDYAIRRKIKGALAYPIFVLIFSLVVVYAMLALLMPNFIPIFKQSGLEISRDYPITQMLMDATATVSNPVFIAGMVIGLIVVVVLINVIGATPPGRLLIDTVKFYFPFVQDLIRMATLTRFCRTFGTLTASGVPLLDSFEHVANAAGNALVAKILRKVSKDVESGARISETLAKGPIFPPLLVQMVTVGEQTGSLDTMFNRVADYYDDELETAVASLTSLIEPAMMIFVGVIVGVIVMGVLLPIMGMSTAQMQQ